MIFFFFVSVDCYAFFSNSIKRKRKMIKNQLEAINVNIVFGGFGLVVLLTAVLRASNPGFR